MPDELKRQAIAIALEYVQTGEACLLSLYRDALHDGGIEEHMVCHYVAEVRARRLELE